MPQSPRISLAALILAAGFFSGTACAETPAAPTAAPESKPVVEPAAPASVVPTSGQTPAEANPSVDSVKQGAKAAQESEADRERRLAVNRMTLEKLRLDAEMQIAQLKLRAATLDQENERARLDAESGLRAAKLALANTDDDIARADREREIAIAASKANLARFKRTAEAAELEVDGRIAKQAADNEVARLGALAAKIRRENEAGRMLDLTVDRPADPVKDGTLFVSDRRIVINGLIADATAQDVITKLNFFAHADAKAPVFLVVETAPGGSSVAAYQIVRAMESCPAPVHAVVKGTAGGAAAAIVASARHSYAIPHSRMVFQHPSVQPRGTNLGSQHDSLRVADAWFRLLYSGIAAKQGMSVEQFTAKLYEKNANGDWLEFGDKAVAAKWVDTLVDRVVEQSVDTIPEKLAPVRAPFLSSMTEYKDADGATCYALPPIAPGDMWSIYDPEHRFRAN